MVFMHRLSGWLGSLSVGRKLMLIYLLDLTAVIYVSGILIHEKYLAIDFTRKEIVGASYAAVVRDGLMGQFLTGGARPSPVGADVLDRLAVVRATHDELLNTADVAQRFRDALDLLTQPPATLDKATDLASARSQLLATGRVLLTAVGNQSNLILDPDLDSYYVMSLVLLRFPELLQAVHETVIFLEVPRTMRGPQWSSELLTLVGRLDAVMQGIEADYDQAFIAGTPEMRDVLQGPRHALKLSLTSFQALLQAIASGESSPSTANLGMQRAAALETLARAWE
ncbi:MAG: sensor domain-containing diguanylate cyclase, partial [Burkholderiaceae bacterium]|nr:sensor domain-containing diguanylate cyclase [Burkholderiaceae bacterium]